MDSALIKELSIPLFTGAIGYLTNAAKMRSIAVE
jgi:hypothetical protein